MIEQCCRLAPRPPIGLGDNRVFPEQLEKMEYIVSRLRYDLPLNELILLMQQAGSNLDTRPRFGADIMRCLVFNGAERLELLSKQIDTRPWRTLIERFRDAWAVFKGNAQAIYVKRSVYDRQKEVL